MDVDVIVVGAGFAGLTAATRAAEHGLSVTVLERGEGADYRCNSRVCTGVYHIGFRSETEPEEELLDRIMGMTGGTARPDLAQTFAASSRRVKDWLIGQGAEFQPYHSQPSGLTMLAPARNLSPGLDWRGKGPDRLLRRLTRILEGKGGAVRLGTAVRDLVMEDGVCVGVETERGGERATLRAPAVVLADGGFQANVELLAKNITPGGRPDPATKRPDRRRRRVAHGGGGRRRSRWARQILRAPPQPRRHGERGALALSPRSMSSPPPAS